MSDLDLDAIAGRLAAGEAIDASVLLDAGSGEERSLLKRCAAARIFDEELVEVLRTALPDPPDAHLDDLVRSRSVEPVLGRPGSFRLPAPARQEHYLRWWSDDGVTADVPGPLKALSTAALEHLEKRDGEELEALFHELLVRPDEAETRFKALYAEADAAVDLARCEDLLDVLNERLGVLGPDLAQLLNDYRRRLRVRATWLDDWYRTARFLVPDASNAAIEALLAGEHGRVLTLSAPGGMGKTSHLRWLISRRCAAAGDACARLDFDAIEPLVATREPWLLLLEAAAQLDRQLPDAPFHELLAQYPGERERLRRRGRPARPVSADAAGPDVFERFVAGLPASGRVVIVVDTLEEALLLGGGTREQSALLPLLDEFARLLPLAPALRLVLAGRYRPHERVPGFATLFPGAAELLLTPFSPEEARRYLTDLRCITRDEVVERIVERSDRVPLKLELIADIAEEKPDLDPAEIDDALAQSDLDYVMDRIVGRVDRDLELLLRYGVAPRVLDRGFAGDVLAGWLPVDGAGDLDALWQRLKRYAGRASWVTLDPLETSVVRFHPEVLRPMRALLRESPEHDEIHRRAAELYEERAESRPAERTRWLQEAVYHRFQREGPIAERYWSGLLAAARVERRPERRRSLAAEVLGPDYVGDDGPLEWRDGRPLIRSATLLRARWELAAASVQLALAGASERREADWLEAERALADLEHLLPADRRSPVIGEAQLSFVRAGIALGRGDLAAAKDEKERALRGRIHPEDALWLRLAYATLASQRGRPDAASQFNVALALAERGRHPGADCAEVLLRLAEHHAQHDRLDRAVESCVHAAVRAEGRQAVEVQLVRSQLALRHGAPSEALALLDRIECDEPEIVAQMAVMRVRTLLAAARPADAVASAEAARARLGDALERSDASLRRLAAEGRELRGKARAALLDEGGAKRDLDWAAGRWSRLGAGGDVSRCFVRIAAFQLRGMGNLREASGHLDQARRTEMARGGDAWTRCTLLGAELLARRGEVARGLRLVDDVIAELRRRARPPRALIEAGMYGLAISDGETADRYLELVCAELAHVTPTAVRLALLEGLDRCPPIRAGSPALARRLRRLVPSPLTAADLYARLAPRDRALLCLRDADLNRVLHRDEAAQRSLRAAQKALSRDGLRPLLGPAIRVGARPIVAAVGRRELASGTARSTLLDGAVALEAAAHLLGSREGRALLERAAAILLPLGASGGRWLAWLEETQGDDAERRGDRDAMREHWVNAAELYDALEDEAARDRALARGSQPRSPRIASVAERELRVTLRLRDGDLVIESQARGRPASVYHEPGERDLVRELLESPPSAAGRAAARATVARVLADPAGVGRELAGLLRSVVPDDLEPHAGAPIDVGLRSKDTAIRGLPWELAASELEPAGLRLWRRAPRARGEPGDVRGVQGALNRLDGAELAEDGILGPLTRFALERIQPKLGVRVTAAADEITVQRLHAQLAGGDVPRVVIVRPTRRAEDLTFRGSRQSGAAVEWAYEREGFTPIVLDAPTPDELQHVLYRRPAAIVHLTAGLVNHHGTAAIDLLAAPRTRGRQAPAGRLTGTALDRLIPRDLPTPLLILDVPAPKSGRESVTQLLLRNAFTAELVAVGTVRAAIATGLAKYGRQRQLYAKLTEALAQGLPVDEVTRRLQAAAGPDPDLDQMLAFAATALFARTPHIRFPGTSAP